MVIFLLKKSLSLQSKHSILASVCSLSRFVVCCYASVSKNNALVWAVMPKTRIAKINNNFRCVIDGFFGIFFLKKKGKVKTDRDKMASIPRYIRVRNRKKMPARIHPRIKTEITRSGSGEICAIPQ